MKPPFFERFVFRFEKKEQMKRLVIYGTIDPEPLKKGEKYLITLFENSTCPHFYKTDIVEHGMGAQGNIVPKYIVGVIDEDKESIIPTQIKEETAYDGKIELIL